MPLFHVEWLYSAEWTVEAPSREAALDAAQQIRRGDLRLEGPKINVFRVHDRRKAPSVADAVVVSGEMMNPDDVMLCRITAAREMIRDEGAVIVCPGCGYERLAEDWTLVSDGLPVSECPACARSLTFADYQCLAWRALSWFDLDPKQRELFSNEDI